MKAFKAYGTDAHVTASTPRAAALRFFNEHPTKRKCNVVEGTVDGRFFTVEYGRYSEGKWPLSFKEVTKKTALELPDEPAA